MTASDDNPTIDTLSEYAFICRTLFRRGSNVPLSENYVKAVELGACEEWFTVPACKIAWKAADKLFMNSGRASSVTIASICREANRIIANDKDLSLAGVKVGIEMFDSTAKYVESSDSLEDYAKALKDALVRRKISDILTEAKTDLFAREDPISILMKLSTSSDGLMDSGNVCHKFSISSLADKALADWDEANHQVNELGNVMWTPGVPLPWYRLSYAIGGFTPDITIIAARPGVGKTSFALNFSRYWVDHKIKVGFVSVDMSPIGFAKRQISERTRISGRSLQFGRRDDWADTRQKIVEQINEIKKLEKSGYFTAYDEYDIDTIKAECIIQKRRNAIDVLIVDYIQLLTCRGASRMTTTDKTKYISQSLHEIANKCGIPVLCLSQLNRDSTKDGGREPQASDIKDSGAIEQDAANIFLLHREKAIYEDWHANGHPPVQFAKNRIANDFLKSLRPITCIIAKAREGDEGTKLPFLVVQSRYAWYLADYENGFGADAYQRVHDDWRHDPQEKIWEENGALIKMEDIRLQMINAINAKRRLKGRPPLPFDAQGNPTLRNLEDGIASSPKIQATPKHRCV